MSKNIEKSVEMPGYENAYLVFAYNIDNVMGKILTLIESLGLKDTQEKAAKDIARDVIGSLFRDTVWLPSEETTPIMVKHTSAINASPVARA